MSAASAVRSALREAERQGLISSWYEGEGRIRAVPKVGPPQIIRSVRDVEHMVDEARRRALAR